jgi:hypothetical protein
LRSQFLVGDFRLSFQVRVAAGGRAGVLFRAEGLPDGGAKGYRAGLGADVGKLTEEHGRGLLASKAGAPVKAGEWDRYEIVAAGGRIQTYLNGKPWLDLKDDGARRGIIALHLPAGTAEVRFKDLRLELTQDRKQLRSGPQQGVHALYTRHVNGRSAGKISLITGGLVTNPRPSIFVFARTAGKPVLELVRKLDAEAARHNLFVAGVFLLDDKDLLPRLKRFVKQDKIRSATLSFTAPGDVGDWKIAKEAEVTVLIYNRKRQLQANFAFRLGEVDERAVREVLEGLSSLFKSKDKLS